MNPLALPLELVVTCVLAVNCIVLFVVWFKEELQQKRRELQIHSEGSKLWRCSICSTFFTEKPAERLTVCPQCGSYNS